MAVEMFGDDTSMDSDQPGLFRRFTRALTNTWFLAVVIAIAAVGWIASGVLAPSPATGDEVTAQSESAAEADLPRVRVATFTSEKISDSLRLQGRTEADRRVTISAETSGTIEELFVERGTTVTEEQVIARLDVDDRQAKVASAQALVVQRETEFEAARRLNAKGYRGDVDLSQAQAALDAAQAELKLANIELERTIVAAPFAGVMFERDVELGDFVDRGDPIAYVVDLSVVTAVGQVSERNLGNIRLGQPAQLRTLTGQLIDGVVSYVGAVADSTTRTFAVEVDVPNGDGTLIEGVTVELNIPMEQLTAHSITPAILTLADDGTLGVRAVDETDHVVFYPVQILQDGLDSVLIGGLPDEVRLITVGQEFVQDGQQVIPIDEGGTTAGSTGELS